MTNSEILYRYIESFYREWIPDVPLVMPTSTEHAILVANHKRLIDTLAPLLKSKEHNHPEPNQKCFGVQDLTTIGKWKFIGEYFYDAGINKFVINIGDSDPYGYVDMWVSFETIDNLSTEEFNAIKFSRTIT